MKLHKSEIILLAIILASFVVGFYFYPQLPEKIASHWNARGEVNGHMSRFWGTFLMPFIFIFLFLLFVIIPRIDPKKENIQKFRKYFDVFIVLIFLFLFYIYFLAMAWNVGYVFDMVQFMAPAVAVIFYYAGVLISHSEPNWTIGIRTPWTMSSESVWRKTHALGGKLFRAAAIISLLGLFFPGQGIWFIIVPILFSAFYSLAYSYFEYKRENRGHSQTH